MSRIFTVSLASVYPHYVAKVEKKGRTKAQLHCDRLDRPGWLSAVGDILLACLRLPPKGRARIPGSGC